MCPFTLLLLPLLTFAAPVSNPPAKPNLEVILSASNQLELEITIQNNSKDTLEIPYRVAPFEHFVVKLSGDQGKEYEINGTPEATDRGTPGTITILPGQSKTITIHTCHYLPELGEPRQVVTFVARMKHGNQVITSKPLTVKP
jgi:hypothetical protein